MAELITGILSVAIVIAAAILAIFSLVASCFAGAVAGSVGGGGAGLFHTLKTCFHTVDVGIKSKAMRIAVFVLLGLVALLAVGLAVYAICLIIPLIAKGGV